MALFRRVKPAYGLKTLQKDPTCVLILDPTTAGSLYRDTSATLSSRIYGDVKAVKDLSKFGATAVQAGTLSTIRLLYDSTGKPYIRLALETDKLTATFGGIVGANCTVIYVNASSVEIRESVNIETTFDVDKSFWFCCVYNRALTEKEKTMITRFLSGKCEQYNSRYDFYVDAAHGSDANDGLTLATAKATLNAAIAQLYASADGSRLYVAEGTYTPTEMSDAATSSTGKTHHIHFPKGACVIDKGETPGGGTASAFTVLYPGHTVKVWGDGNLKIQNVQNNCFGVSASGIGHIYDALTTSGDDGVTGHDNCTIVARRVTSNNNNKSAFAHTTGSGVMYSEHYGCVFVGRLTSSLGCGSIDNGVNALFEDCDFLPDPNTTSDWSAYKLAVTNLNGATSSSTRFFRRCRMGDPSITPGSNIAPCLAYNAMFDSCYIRGWDFGGEAAGSTTTYNKCYGKWSVRPRRTVTHVSVVDHCVFNGGAAIRSNNAIGADYYSSPSDVFGSGIISNNIFTSCATGVYVASNQSVFNDNYQLLNNLFYSNTTDKSAGVTSDGTDVTGQNPLLIDTTTADIEGWMVSAGSPAIGAGTSGSNIGL